MGSLLENRPPRTYPPPEYMLQQESHKGRLETSGKMTARNPADKVHYIVRFRDWRLTHSVTLALDAPKMGTVESGEFNNRRLPSFAFQGLSERESSTSWS